jgi:xanthine dehydrogenase iron-sulfur cluster and FAD-binding subunit A
MAAITNHTAFEKLAPFIRGARSTLDFYINGSKIELSSPDPEHTLLDFLRSQPGLKGTKLGCGEGGWCALSLASIGLVSRVLTIWWLQWRMYLCDTDIRSR